MGDWVRARRADAEAGLNWEAIGWRIRVNFTRLLHRVRPKDHMLVLASDGGFRFAFWVPVYRLALQSPEPYCEAQSEGTIPTALSGRPARCEH